MLKRPQHPNTIKPRPPKRFPITQVRLDLKRFAIKLVEAGAQGTLLWGGDASALSGLIQAISSAAETVHIERSVGELAWELVRKALIRAMADLYDEGAGAREPAKGDLDHLKARVEIELADPAVDIPRTLFKNPGAIPLVAVVRERFASWLRLLDLSDADAASLANRLPTYAAFAFHEEWRSRRDHYQPVFEHYEGPFTAAVQMAWDWERNRQALIRQLDEPVFEETFSLRQVYVPLRAYWREEIKDREARTVEGKHRLHVIDLHEAIEDWLKPAEHGDAIRLVSGGPGSGKSSFAKKLAADLAETNRMRVLFFPLQRFPTHMPVQQAIETWLQGSGAFAESPIRQPEFASSNDRLLLIFDGLDELTKPGDLADEMTREFVQQLCTQVGIWNASQRRVLVLITGRTIVAQQHRRSLGLGEAQGLAVLPYLLDEEDKAELARREQADIRDGESRLKDDQRQIWWSKYSKAKGQADVLFPAVLHASRHIRELTKEPLLNYLVVLSGFHQQDAEHPPRNRNIIYEKLLRDVLDRRYAKRHPKERDPVLAGIDEVKDRETFERLLESIATAAWYGDGRTTTLQEARSLCPDDLQARFDELTERKGGFVRLLAAVYFQESREPRESADAFEFTHKSFGEYLTARRLVREISELHENLSRPRARYTEDDALRDWSTLTGPQAMTLDLLSFLRHEVALRDHADVKGWQETLTRLFNRNLSSGPPIDAFVDKRLRPIEQKARNAEEALLSALNACALYTLKRSVVIWPNQESAGNLLHRLRGQRGSLHSAKTALKCLSWLDMAGQRCSWQELSGANLSYSDLSGIELAGANLRDADLSDARLTGADLSAADLTAADLSDANLSDANLSDAKLNRANLGGADLTCAVLAEADLTRAVLLYADLSTADLHRAILSNATFFATNLSGADLSSARGLTWVQLSDAWGDGKTKLSSELTISMEPR